MNKTVPSATNWPDERPRKKTVKLRVIDQGTAYDVSGRMIRWARELRTGKLGRCTDVLIVARCMGKDGLAYEHFSNGTGTNEIYLAMAQSAIKRHQ
jgi:hypothetical protein